MTSLTIDAPTLPTTSAKRVRRKRSPAPYLATAPEGGGDVGIVLQVKIACHPRNRLAACIGMVFGAFVPLAVYVVSHYDLDLADPWSPALALVVGGLLYSATTVYQWGLQAFGSWYKALGFAILVEGTMCASDQAWLSIAALVLLCSINAIATGVALVRGGK